MSNWKKYGGVNNLEHNNNLNVYSLVADIFTLRKSYYGTFDISGELNVSGNARIHANLRVSNITVLNDISTNRLFVNEKTIHYDDVDICGNLIVKRGNLNVLTDINVQGVIHLQNQLYLGNSGNAYLFGTDVSGNIGLNTTTPIATFDISSSKPLAFNVGTATHEQIYSIPIQNVNKRGIILSANTNTSQIHFYNDASLNTNTSTSNGSISYSNGGVLSFDVSENINILSKLSVTNRTSNITSHVMGETAVIYDTSSGTYLQPVYQNLTETTGNALSLVANDNSSNTFLNIITPNKNGLSIGGGAYPNDQKRAMGSIGWRDTSANYTPAMNIVSGSSKIRYKSTVGVNTHAPNTEKYVVDINGPIQLKNGELTITKQTNMEIRHLAVGKTSSNNAVAIGTPYTNTGTFKQRILYTNTGGEKWIDNYDLSGDSIETKLIGLNINTAFVYDASITIIAGDYAYAYYTYNGYEDDDINAISWQTITTPFNTSANARNYSIKSIFVTPTVPRRMYFGIDSSGENSFLYWFNIPDIISGGFSSSINSDASFNLLFSGIKSMDGCGNTLWIAVGNKIVSFNTLFPSMTTSYTNSIGNYNSIYVLNPNSIAAVGNNIISFTVNGGSSWRDVSMNIPVLNRICLLDSSNAIAVGNAGIVLASSNWQTGIWTNVSTSILNVSGNANQLIDSSYNLTNVGFIDSNNFYITKTIQQYSSSSIGNTSLFHVYLPNLFNNITNYVFDISGSVRMSGDMNINDEGKLSSNNQTFNLLNNNVNRVNLGGDASNVYIGSLRNSTVTANSNFNVLSESTLDGNLLVKRNAFINANLNVTGNTNINSTLNVTGNAIIRSNLNVTGNTNINSTLNVTGNANITSTLNVTGNTNINSTLNVTGNTNVSSNFNVTGNANVRNILNVTGNANMNSNLNVTENTNIGAILNVTGNTNVNANLNVTGNTIINSALNVTGNTDLTILNVTGNTNLATLNITGNTNVAILNVTGNANINANLNVVSDSSLSGNLYANKIIRTSVIESLSGNLGIGPNPSDNNGYDICIGGFNITDAQNRNIKIGNFNNNPSNSNVIYIGGPNDDIIIQGEMTQTDNVKTGPILYINSGNLNSVGAGLHIGDFENLDSGYFVVSNDRTGYILKSTQNPNVIKLDISNLIIPNSSQTTGLVSIYRNDEMAESDYSVYTSSIDPNNIILGNTSYSQTISANLNLSNVYVSETLEIAGNTNIGGFLTVTGNSNISGLLTVTGNVTMANLNVTGNVLCANVYLNKTYDIDGDTVLTYPLYNSYNIKTLNANNVTITLPTISSGQTEQGSIVNFYKSGNLSLPVFIVSPEDGFVENGKTTVESSFSIPAGTTSASLISSFGANGNYWTGIGGGGGGGGVAGNSTIGGSLNVTGSTTLSNLSVSLNANVTGTTTSGNLISNGRLNVTGNANVGNLSSAGTITSTGNATIGSVLTVNSGGIISGGLTVSTGNFTVTGTANITANANVGNLNTASINASGTATIGTTLSVTGLSTLRGGLTVTGGEINMYNSLNVTGGGTVSGGLSVSTGNMTVNSGNISASGTISATGTATVGNLSTGGTISSTGDATIGGNLNVNGGTTTLASVFVVNNSARTNNGLVINGGCNITNGLVVNDDSFTKNLTVSGTTSTDGITVRTGGLTVSSGGLTVSSGGLTVTNTGITVNNGGINVTGLGNLKNGLTVTGGAINMYDNLSVTGTSSISGALSVTGATTVNNISVNGNITSGGTATINSLFVTGNATVNTNLRVTGTITSGGTATVNSLFVTGDAFVNSNLRVTGTSSIGGALSVTGATTVNNNLSVTGTITSGGTATVNSLFVTGDAFVNSNLRVTGTCSIGGALSVTGATTVNNNLSVTGTITSSGTATVNSLSVTGDATIGSGLTVNVGTTKAAAGLVVEGGCNIKDALIVTTGKGFFLDGLSVTGTSSLNAALSVTGNITSSGTATVNVLSVTGTATVGNLSTGGTIGATGTATVGSLTTGGTISATGNVSGGNLSTGGTITATGTATVGNLSTGGTIGATGTATVGNLSTGGTIGATGSATAGNLITSGFGNIGGVCTVGSNLNVTGNATIAGNITVTGNIIGLKLGNDLVIGGGTSAAGYALTVNGNVQATSYNATSDRRLKSNIQFLSNQTNSILNIKPVTFDWKVDGRHDIGFIAQNIYQIYPELKPKIVADCSNQDEPVDASGNPIYYAIDYGRMTPFLWQGMREIIQRLEIVETENINLKSRIEILESINK